MSKEEYCQKCGKATSVFKATYVPLFGWVCRPCWSNVVSKVKQ